ncbi:Twf1p [Sugiyamaella lignohabitans]|uniref:Twf1p n=1 Tax=Sugiyamaella lignohabitans TaxID=796027 RepID=A0A167E6G9_9ASCO|nr:Twf1p [Sugiyamaella lignohabitans]ANB13704.1 Twf1p [Sugiyamaella lignohabitans]
MANLAESCEPGKVIPKQSDRFEDDFDGIQRQLNAKEANYVAVKQNGPDAKFVFISFVPDAAPVRSKMLYASSSNTIYRELGGTQRFATSLFWTDLSEVSSSGWNAHVKHEQATAPMTEEERSLQEVLHREVDQMIGTGERKNEIHRIQLSGSSRSGTGLSLAVDDAVHEAFKQLHSAEPGSALGLHVDMDRESVIVGKPLSAVHADKLGDQFIDGSKPQYTIYKHASPTGETDKIVFIYTCPSGSKIKERMVYASNRESVVSFARTHVDVIKVVEATDGSDISHTQLNDELYPESSETSSTSSTPRSGGFARPKRPGRR